MTLIGKQKKNFTNNAVSKISPDQSTRLGLEGEARGRHYDHIYGMVTSPRLFSLGIGPLGDAS